MCVIYKHRSFERGGRQGNIVAEEKGHTQCNNSVTVCVQRQNVG